MESYNLRHAPWSFSTILSSVYWNPVDILVFSSQLCITTKLMLMYLMTAYYTPNNGFTGVIQCFTKTKLASYTTSCTVILYKLSEYAFAGALPQFCHRSEKRK